MFGLAMIAALLNLILLKFMTMNTEDENRDEIEALEAARMTVKLDGDIIMGEIVADKRYAASFGGSDEDLGSVCSCNCVSCHPGVSLFPVPARGKRFFLRGNRSSSPCMSPPPVYSDYYQSPPRSRPESVHDIRSCDYDGLSLLATISRTSPRPSVMEEAVSHFTVSHASSQFRVHSRWVRSLYIWGFKANVFFKNCESNLKLKLLEFQTVIFNIGYLIIQLATVAKTLNLDRYSYYEFIKIIGVSNLNSLRRFLVFIIENLNLIKKNIYSKGKIPAETLARC